MTSRYDAIVIGSGFGGAVTACRLAEAGHSVAVLERGRRWSADDFPRTLGQVADTAFWADGRSHGFLEYLAFRTLDVIQGSGVGGGSLHYFNVNVRAPERILGEPPWPTGTAAALDPYYRLVEGVLGSTPLQPPPGQDALPPRTTAFLAAARAAGRDVTQVPIAVHTGPPRAAGPDGRVQQSCTYCGNCLLGCHLSAKNTLDLTYLARAERRGAEVLPLHVVDTLRPRGARWEVGFRRLAEDPAGPATSGTLLAEQVVVAAGSLGSTRLLLRNRDVSRTLPRLGPALGSRFSVNGEFLFARAEDTPSRTDPSVGPPITAMSTSTTGRHVITVQDLGLPDQLLWFLEGAVPTHPRLRGLLALARSYAGRSLGLGGRATRVGLEVDALLAGGRTPRAIPYLGMGNDTADGRIGLRRGELDVSWSPRRNRDLYRAIERAMSEISAAAGGRFRSSPLWGWPLRKVLTAHPLGGCPLGEDPTTSVVDPVGRSWSYPGLSVVDGSVIPTALAVNPSLTIAALAERAAALLVSDHEAPPVPAPPLDPPGSSDVHTVSGRAAT